ncbi:zinc finger C2H2-like protein [Chaetomidium leptoderma]|uniref:Zinc finger C2H2-like protein n=1 Tax=Chaetomidium leptoderma TaxID=669021 RepID=A0AAN6VEA9_9PEZI|nr:zinc finger C2H2-like protein [Chaetomidium leptoderma]
MSNFPQHRAMHDAGPFTAAIHTGQHSHGAHAVHHQQAAAVTGHHHFVPCPYEDKVTKDGTTARMVLLFLRELLEQLSVSEQVQQSYACPMTKCRGAFVAPLQVIQHLLSCPELASGEFDCDRCSTSHHFPTNEKDWAQWAGWTCPHPLHGAHMQRKRSLGSKMRDFALGKKGPSRKQNHPAYDSHFKNASPMDTRPSTAVSEAPSATFTSRVFPHHPVFPGQPAQGAAGPAFSNLQKPQVILVPPGLPEVDGSVFWSGFNEGSSDLPSTVSSIALSSSTVDGSPSERLSQNTSQSTLFNHHGLGPYQQPPATSAQDSNTISASQHQQQQQQQYMFPPHLTFNTGLTSLPGHPPPSSAMCVDDPLPLASSPLSPTELRSTVSSNHGWWGPKLEVETPRPTPPPSSSAPNPRYPLQASMLGSLARSVSSGVTSPTSPDTAASPYYQIQQPTSTHSMSRALSQESMQSNITTVFGTPAPEGRGGLGALSPRADNCQHSAAAAAAAATQGKVASESSVEDLVCDECQWKPRGVRENLKGYLRKHKNTHKGVRLACDIPGCVKTFSRLDNLKKHKKDKHGIEDTGSSVPVRTVGGEFAESIAEEEAEPKRPGTVESDIRAVAEDYSMLWPALHF